MWQRLAIWALLLAGIVYLAQHTPTSAYWQTRDSAYNNPVAGGAISYVGPQSVVTGALGWWGSSGYTNTDTAPAWNVCNVSDVVCTDWPIGANGYITPALVGGSNCGVVTCTIKTIYDRSGAMHCAGPAACDMTQNTIGDRATVQLNALGTFACASMSAGSTQGYTSASNFVQSQPVTALAVAKRTGTPATNAYLGSSSSIVFFFTSSADTVAIFGGGAVTAMATDNSFHSIQSIANDPTNDTFYIDGTSTSTASAGTNTFTGSLYLLRDASASQSMQGLVCDVGVWAGTFSAPNQASMNANRHAAYGVW